MKQQFHYATVTEAIEQLRNQGFTLDLNLKENHITAGEQAFPAEEFEIVDLYRYEGASDPADEATVYALANPSGLKGILVAGYGISTDDDSTETLKQLHYKYLEGKKG
ncbi:phosphoribosylpyrophosphate synthetase [Mucilaginibacter sp.]|uniref:phosphoribosylpyrophosphate synthetase n=1 Tax=Mucilaginibacter sp. TaxID=1882438 RepID=UPI0028412219|nr:phosphoribosylpyrophosphate synthetase [Mucilaginibacter sp.]MDR3695412.1 phosphoribosylpyrophosphate synthetase [Mucilaginibacter sp.]